MPPPSSTCCARHGITPTLAEIITYPLEELAEKSGPADQPASRRLITFADRHYREGMRRLVASARAKRVVDIEAYRPIPLRFPLGKT